MYTVMENDGVACYPVRNLVSNLGFRPDATHTTFVDARQSYPPAANRVHQKLAFPLVHPSELSRSVLAERQIEAIRLGLRPQSVGAKLKAAVRKFFDERTMGMLDYWRFPSRRAGWGGAFNGQRRRQELFAALVEKIRPGVIVETGTYLGTTTEFMAEAGVPIYSVESNPRYYGFARARLWRKRHVTIRHDDSRKALRAFFAAPLRSPGGSVLAYLDVHWNEELPLADELEIIFELLECSGDNRRLRGSRRSGLRLRRLRPRESAKRRVHRAPG